MKQREQKEFYNVPNEPVSEGVIMEGVLSHLVSPKTAISYAENMHNDTIGFMTTRRGIVATAESPAARVKNATSYTYTAGGSSGTTSVCWQEGTTFKTQDLLGTGAIVSFASKFGASKAHFDITQGILVMASGEAAQPRQFSDVGTGPAVLGTSFPNGMDLISSGYIGRIWCADSTAYTNRVYYSDVINATFTSTTGGASYLTINANSGDKITGFARTQGVLYVFTHNSIFRIYNTQSLDYAPMSTVGAFSQDAIVKTKAGFFFYHPSGIYQLTDGGQPKEISIKIRDILQQIPNANQSNVFGWSDDDHVYFSVGNLPSMSTTNQYIIRYTISTQVWTFYTVSNASLSLTCATSLNPAVTSITSNDIYPSMVIFADDTVNFYKGTLDVFLPATKNSTVTIDYSVFPIFAEFQTNWMNFEPEIPESHDHRANGLFIFSENAAGFKVAYQIDSDLPNVWREIGVIGTEYLSQFDRWQSAEFNRIKFRVYGHTNGKTVKIGTPKIRVLDDLGYKTN
jgi:hypothetical protein